MSSRRDATVQLPKAWRDLAILLGVALASAWIAGRLNLSERLAAYTRGREGLQLDELPFVLLVVTLVLVILAERRRRDLKRELMARAVAEARLGASLDANRELSHQHLREQEAERRRLARELHDEFGQYLNAIKLDAVALRDSGPGDLPVQQAARQIVANIDHMHAAVGGMIGRLRPAALDDLGLSAAVEACVDGWRRRLPQMRFELQVQGDLEGLGESLNVAVFRLIQEGLTNAVRHSGSSVVRIDLRRTPDAPGILRLRLSDEGRGAEPGRLLKGFGLRGMRERVELLQGRLELVTAPGAGFRLNIELPVQGGTP